MRPCYILTKGKIVYKKIKTGCEYVVLAVVLTVVVMQLNEQLGNNVFARNKNTKLEKIEVIKDTIKQQVDSLSQNIR